MTCEQRRADKQPVELIHLCPLVGKAGSFCSPALSAEVLPVESLARPRQSREATKPDRCRVGESPAPFGKIGIQDGLERRFVEPSCSNQKIQAVIPRGTMDR